MEVAEEELERRSKFLSSLIQKKKAEEQQRQKESLNVQIRASDMPIPLQSRAFRCARELIDSMPAKLDSKRLALALKKTGMEVSDTVENQQHESALAQRSQEGKSAAPPHEALCLVLSYLPSLFEILSVGEVCRSLRDAINSDVLPWWNLIIDSPLNLMLSDDILMRITSKANGGLRTLALFSCRRITDDGLQQVIQANPLISELYLPGCTGLTPDGVIKAVKTLTECRHSLKSLSINGIYNVKKEHFEMLCSYLCLSPLKQMQHPPIFYHDFRNEKLQASRQRKIDRVIDVEICPKCNNVRMVFDCPREGCRRKREMLVSDCRACDICIPRCEECGRCVLSDELEDTVCADVLCSDCWLQLPKCSFCNKPYCKRHACRMCNSSSSQIICDSCDLMCPTKRT